MTTTTPVPTPPPPATPPPGSRSLRIALLAVGSALVAALLVLGVLQFAQAASGEDESGRYVVQGDYTALDVDVSAADVRVRYADVDRARLELASSGTSLHLEREVRGGTLSVRLHERGWWHFGFLGQDAARLEVVLPEALAPVALDVRSSAGDSRIDGAFAATSVESSAGSIRLSGSTGPLRLDSSAGDITATALRVAGPVETDSSAGTTRLSFASLPSSIDAEGSAGDIDVRLPDGDYDVRASTSFGDLDQQVRSTPGAERRYTFETSAGDIRLRAE